MKHAAFPERPEAGNNLQTRRLQMQQLQIPRLPEKLPNNHKLLTTLLKNNRPLYYWSVQDHLNIVKQMTGIAGILYPDIFHIHKLMDPILDSLSQRGSIVHEEAARDVYSYKDLSLGVSGGLIAANPKKSLIAILDGKIYNYDELSLDLKNAGYDLTTTNQSEVLIYAYEAWGEEFAKKINGDFAAAIFDKNKNTLYLYRDRVGVKPLYWFFDQNHFIFGSDIKSLLASDIIPQTPATDSIAFYLALGYIPQDMTPIQNVNKLLPAHYLKFSRETGMSIHPYWSYGEKFLSSKSEPIESVRRNLDCFVQ